MRQPLTMIPLVLMAGCATTEMHTSQSMTVERKPPAGEFASNTVDFGIVVSDAAKAAEFYQRALGFTEVPGFDVPADMGGDSGLSDYQPFHVRIMVLGQTPGATKVKLMEFRDAPGARPDNRFIHSTLGVRYLTLYVTEIDAAVERARKAGAAPLAKGPIVLPKGFPAGVYLAVVRDPDGNMIELVGPRK